MKLRKATVDGFKEVCCDDCGRMVRREEARVYRFGSGPGDYAELCNSCFLDRVAKRRRTR